jgi:hypothetical protein
MFIRRAVIRNIRSIARIEWEPDNEGPGWHVVLGDNGAGKSSFLRSLALALLGPTEALAARQDWNTWLRTGEDSGFVDIAIVPDAKYDSFSGPGRASYSRVLIAAVGLDRTKQVGNEVELRSRVHGSAVSPKRHVWGTGDGWFSAAFGPFRRFTGGDKDVERSFLSNPKLGAHISVFGENVALTEGLYWLRELNYKKLEHSPEGGLLQRLKHFINQEGFLPYSIKLAQLFGLAPEALNW